MTNPNARPVCRVPGCQRPCRQRDTDRYGRVRYRPRCDWHHRHGDEVPAPPMRDNLTLGLTCRVKGCPRAPEAFRRPGGVVYVRDVCRPHRGAMLPVRVTTAVKGQKQPVAPTVAAPPALTAPHIDVKTSIFATDRKARKRGVAKNRKGIWVLEDGKAWQVPVPVAVKWATYQGSTFDLAKSAGYPTRVVILIQAAISKGWV
jgi:hypothetical protein